MSALLQAAAAAIVADLNGQARPWAGQFTAVREYCENRDAQQLKNLTVTVIAHSRRTLLSDRQAPEKRLIVQIGFQKHTKKDTAANDALSALMEQVADYFEPGDRLFPPMDRLVIEETDIPAAFDWRQMSQGIFQSILILTLRTLD
jgi:hypothetical protein